MENFLSLLLLGQLKKKQSAKRLLSGWREEIVRGVRKWRRNQGQVAGVRPDVSEMIRLPHSVRRQRVRTQHRKRGTTNTRRMRE